MKIILLSLFFSSYTFASGSFLGAINTEAKPISYQELLEEISVVAKETNVNFSVGESHLHSESVLKINKELILKYFENSAMPVVTCLESLSHFDASEIGQYVFANSKKATVFQKNSPGLTDFKNCFEGKRNNYFTYSGFFHQYPFARPFPNEFPATPVISRNGNNILEQMNKTKSFFVTHIELEYLEYVATRALLMELSKTGDVENFLQKTKELIEKVDYIISKSELILNEGNKFLNKKGTILSQDNFFVDLLGKNNFFLIANFEYRDESKSLHLLRGLLNKGEFSLIEFAKKVATSRIYISTLFSTPNVFGELPLTGYGTYGQIFPGNAYLIDMTNEQEKKLWVFAPEVNEPYCLDSTTTQLVSCF